MREIKFRAWNLNEKIMIYPNCINTLACLVAIPDGGRIGDDTRWLEYDNFDRGVPCILMQFTGLLDKNGKDIYEGDILKRDDSVALVIWHNNTNGYLLGKFSKKSREKTFDIKNYKEKDIECIRFIGNKDEIVGNIYENPKLLEASK